MNRGPQFPEKRRRLLGALGSAGLLGLVACGGNDPEAERGPPRIESVSPSGRVLSTTPITVQFTAPVSDPNEVAGRFAPDIHVDPPLALRYHWAAPDRLELIPEEPFQPGVRYRFRLADIEIPPAPRVKGGRFEVHRALFRLSRVYGRRRGDLGQVTVTFNLPVAPEAARPRVTFRGASGNKPARLLTAEPARRLRFEVPGVAQDSELSVRVAAELAPATGGDRLGKPVVREVSLVPGPLDVEDGRFDRLDDDFGLVLRVNGEVDPGRVRGNIEISPGPVRAIRRHPEGVIVVGPVAGQSHHVTVRSGMPAEDGRLLEGSVELDIEAGASRSRLKLVASDGFVLLDPDGRAQIESRGVQRIRVRIWRVPRAAARFDEGPPRSPGDGAGMLVGEQTVSTGKASIEVPVPAAELYAVEVADTDRPWIRSAGWVMGRGLLLSAHASPQHFDVQVRDAGTLRTASRVRVTAYTRAGRSLGSVYTDRSGHARWSVLSAYDPVVWVTAVKGRAFALLPLDHAEHRIRPLSASGTVRPPLVVDRHRYVDGETVSGVYLASLPRGASRRVFLKNRQGRVIEEGSVSRRGAFALKIPVGTPADFLAVELRVDDVLWAEGRVAVQSAGPQPFLLAVDARAPGAYAVRVLPGDVGLPPEQVELSGVCVSGRPRFVQNGFGLMESGPTVHRAVPRQVLRTGSEARITCPLLDAESATRIELVADAGLQVRQIGISRTTPASEGGRWSLRRRLTPKGLAVEGVGATPNGEESADLVVERVDSPGGPTVVARRTVQLTREPKVVAAPPAQTGRYRYTLFDARGRAKVRLEAVARTSTVGLRGERLLGLYGPVSPDPSDSPGGVQRVQPARGDTPLFVRVVSARAGVLRVHAERYGVFPTVSEVSISPGATIVPVTLPPPSSIPLVRIRAELRSWEAGVVLLASSAVLPVPQDTPTLDARVAGQRIELQGGGAGAQVYVAVVDRSRRTHPTLEWTPRFVPGRHYDSLALHGWAGRTVRPAVPAIPQIPLDVAGALDVQPPVILWPVDLTSDSTRRWFSPRNLPHSPELMVWVRQGHGIERFRRGLTSPGPDLRLDVPRQAHVGDRLNVRLELGSPGLQGEAVSARVFVAGGLKLAPGVMSAIEFVPGVSSQILPLVATDPEPARVAVQLVGRQVLRSAQTRVAGPIATTPFGGVALSARLGARAMVPSNIDRTGAKLLIGPGRAFGYAVAWGDVLREPPGPIRDAAWVLASRALSGLDVGGEPVTTQPLKDRLTVEGATAVYPGGPVGPARQDVLVALAFVEVSEKLPVSLALRLRRLGADPFRSVEAAMAALIMAREEACPEREGWFERRGNSSAIEAIVAAIEIHCAQDRSGPVRLSRVRASVGQPWEDALAVLALAAAEPLRIRSAIFVRGLTARASQGRWESVEVNAVALSALAKFDRRSAKRSSFYGNIRQGRTVWGRFTGRRPRWFAGGHPDMSVAGSVLEVYGPGTAWGSVLTPQLDGSATAGSPRLSLAVDLLDEGGRLVDDRVRFGVPLTLRIGVGAMAEALARAPVIVHVPLPAGFAVLGLAGERPPGASLSLRDGAVGMVLPRLSGDRVMLKARVVPRVLGRFLMPGATAKVPWGSPDLRVKTALRRIEVVSP